MEVCNNEKGCSLSFSLFEREGGVLGDHSIFRYGCGGWGIIQCIRISDSISLTHLPLTIFVLGRLYFSITA